MDKQRAAISSIDDYIASFPDAVQGQLQELRATIRAAAPEAEGNVAPT